MKTCTKCKIEKEEIEFAKDKRIKSGWNARCKKCINSSYIQPVEIDKAKTCSKCHIEKPVLEFTISRHGLYGVRADCRLCCKTYARSFKEANPERVKAWWRGKKKIRSADYKENDKKRRQTPEYKRRRVAYLESKKEHIAKRQLEYKRRNPTQHLRSVVSSNMMSHLKQSNISKNRRSWEKIVGYSVEDLKAYLDVELARKGWTWEGLGKFGSLIINGRSVGSAFLPWKTRK